MSCLKDILIVDSEPEIVKLCILLSQQTMSVTQVSIY